MQSGAFYGLAASAVKPACPLGKTHTPFYRSSRSRLALTDFHSSASGGAGLRSMIGFQSFAS